MAQAIVLCPAITCSELQPSPPVMCPVPEDSPLIVSGSCTGISLSSANSCSCRVVLNIPKRIPILLANPYFSS